MHSMVRLASSSAAAALLVAVASVGCGPGDPRACTVTCGAAGACPDGTACGTDGYCHSGEEPPESCALMRPDADVEEPDANDRPDASPPDAGPPSFAGQSAPRLQIPDNSVFGIETVIEADTPSLEVETVEVHLEIAHPWRGDLILILISPIGEIEPVVVLDPADQANDVRGTFAVNGFTPGSSGDGPWTLRLEDRGPDDIGILEYWSIGINRPAP